jgi:hypothetical protein
MARSESRGCLIAYVFARIFGSDSLGGAVVDASINAVTPPFAATEIDPNLVAVLGHFGNERDDLLPACAASHQRWGY